MRSKKYREEAIRSALEKVFEDLTIEVKSINNKDDGMHIIFDNPVVMQYHCTNTRKKIDLIIEGIKLMEGSI